MFEKRSWMKSGMQNLKIGLKQNQLKVSPKISLLFTMNGQKSQTKSLKINSNDTFTTQPNTSKFNKKAQKFQIKPPIFNTSLLASRLIDIHKISFAKIFYQKNLIVEKYIQVHKYFFLKFEKNMKMEYEGIEGAKRVRSGIVLVRKLREWGI